VRKGESWEDIVSWGTVGRGGRSRIVAEGPLQRLHRACGFGAWKNQGGAFVGRRAIEVGNIVLERGFQEEEERPQDLLNPSTGIVVFQPGIGVLLSHRREDIIHRRAKLPAGLDMVCDVLRMLEEDNSAC